MGKVTIENSIDEIQNQIRENSDGIGGKCPNPDCNQTIQRISKPLCSDCLRGVVDEEMYDMYLNPHQYDDEEVVKKSMIRILSVQRGENLDSHL